MKIQEKGHYLGFIFSWEGKREGGRKREYVKKEGFYLLFHSPTKQMKKGRREKNEVKRGTLSTSIFFYGITEEVRKKKKGDEEKVPIYFYLLRRGQ